MSKRKIAASLRVSATAAVECDLSRSNGYATATPAPSKGRLMRCTVDGLRPTTRASRTSHCTASSVEPSKVTPLISSAHRRRKALRLRNRELTFSRCSVAATRLFLSGGRSREETSHASKNNHHYCHLRRDQWSTRPCSGHLRPRGVAAAAVATVVTEVEVAVTEGVGSPVVVRGGFGGGASDGLPHPRPASPGGWAVWAGVTLQDRAYNWATLGDSATRRKPKTLMESSHGGRAESRRAGKSDDAGGRWGSEGLKWFRLPAWDQPRPTWGGRVQALRRAASCSGSNDFRIITYQFIITTTQPFVLLQAIGGQDDSLLCGGVRTQKTL